MGKPLATIAMADQHRATPEQWRRVTRWAKEDKSGTDSCILELRARIEALEATQHAHADLSRLSDAEREQIYAEMAKPAAWRPLDIETTYGTAPTTTTAQQIMRAPMVVEGTFEHGGETYRFKAKPERDAPMDELRAASAEARPAKGLVLRVSEANNSRDAIRAVAAWLRSEYPRREGFGTAWANLIEQEADRG